MLECWIPSPSGTSGLPRIGLKTTDLNRYWQTAQLYTLFLLLINRFGEFLKNLTKVSDFRRLALAALWLLQENAINLCKQRATSVVCCGDTGLWGVENQKQPQRLQRSGRLQALPLTGTAQ